MKMCRLTIECILKGYISISDILKQKLVPATIWKRIYWAPTAVLCLNAILLSSRSLLTYESSANEICSSVKWKCTTAVAMATKSYTDDRTHEWRAIRLLPSLPLLRLPSPPAHSVKDEEGGTSGTNTVHGQSPHCTLMWRWLNQQKKTFHNTDCILFSVKRQPRAAHHHTKFNVSSGLWHWSSKNCHSFGLYLIPHKGEQRHKAHAPYQVSSIK